MVIVAFLAHSDVLADRQLVAPGRLHEEICSLLAKLGLIRLDRLKYPAFVLFYDSMHLGDSLSVLHEIGLVLVPVLGKILEVTEAHHLVDVGLLGAESLAVNPNLLELTVDNLLDFRIFKPFSFALEHFFLGSL